jgi:hypothetical protein
MKKIITLLSLTACIASTAFGQVVDGILNEASYTTIATRGTSSPSFGSGIDATTIKVRQGAGVVYIGVTGFLDPTNSNAIGLMLNFSSTSHPSALTGATAGTDLRVANGGGFINYHVKTGFQVDYAFNLNPGGSATNCYVNAAKYIGSASESYLGNIEQTGFETADVGATGFFASSGVSMAFKRDLANANAGFEMKIPFSALGLPNNAQLSVQAFAFVASETAYFSNITLPGTPTTGQLGQDGAGNFVTGDPTAPNAPTINFGPLAGGPYYTTPATVIPIEMASFDAKPINNTVKLNWLTASERNNGYFDIERSANGRDWSAIGQVKGNGTTAKATNYAFVDEAPLATVNYYRLKQVDMDGKSSYSATVSVNFKGVGKQLSVFPNPANDRLNLVSDRFDTEGVVEIYDLSGRLVQSVRNTATQLDISRLNAGLYQLRLLDKTGAVMSQTRFVKN